MESIELIPASLMLFVIDLRVPSKLFIALTLLPITETRRRNETSIITTLYWSLDVRSHSEVQLQFLLNPD